MKIIKIVGLSLTIIGIFLPIRLGFAYQKEAETHKRIINEALTNDDFYAMLEIPKINLQYLLYPVSSLENNINKTVFVQENSIFPEKSTSNIILAAHSGLGLNAYFRNLYKLSIGDTLKIHYNEKIYTYEIKEIEYQKKNGILYLKEDYPDMVTLITCTYHDNENQTIYYAKML